MFINKYVYRIPTTVIHVYIEIFIQGGVPYFRQEAVVGNLPLPHAYSWIRHYNVIVLVELAY